MLKTQVAKQTRPPAGKTVDRVMKSEFDPVASFLVQLAPKNDEQIASDASQALHGSGYVQLRQVKVYCNHGRITLQGRVTTYYMKQVAQEIVRGVAHVRDIDNDLRVNCPG